MFEVLVRRKTVETKDIVSFELVAIDEDLLPAFEAGAHVDVHLGAKMVRQYSLINHPAERNVYKIAVLNDPNSRGGSRAMHESVKVGDKLTISSPRNLFPLVPTSHKIWLFGGGIGITPLLSMAKTLAQQHRDFELHYHTQTQSKTAFYQELQDCAFADKVFFHFDDKPADNINVVANVLSAPSNQSHVYTCGPGGFMQYIFNTAIANGWQEHNLHKEVFSAEPQSDSGADKAFELILSRSGLTLLVPPDKSALEVIEEAGVNIDVSCEQGICGTCLTAVTCGEVDHRDQFLTIKEKAQHNQFTPCCSRAVSDSLTISL